MTSDSLEQVQNGRRLRLLGKLRSDGHLAKESTQRAMAAVARERFIPAPLMDRAYDDEPLAIGLDQTISAPHMVAIMTDALEAGPGMRVLEVGTGSGYQAAVLSHVVGPAGSIVSIERIDALARRARAALRASGVTNVEVKIGDGSLGFSERAPYDRIIVTASAPDIPSPLLAQLADDGVLLVPVGGRECNLVRVRKTTTGFTREVLGACAFVPLLGAHGQDPRPLGQ